MAHIESQQRPCLRTAWHHGSIECFTGLCAVAGLEQMLAVDVLTGKATEMVSDRSLCNAPKVEDESIGM